METLASATPRQLCGTRPPSPHSVPVSAGGSPLFMQNGRKGCIENDQIHIPYNCLQHNQLPVAPVVLGSKSPAPHTAPTAPSRSHGLALVCDPDLTSPAEPVSCWFSLWISLLLPSVPPPPQLVAPSLSGQQCHRSGVSLHAVAPPRPLWLRCVPGFPGHSLLHL